MINVLLAFIISFVCGLGLVPLVFWLVDKARAKQTILHYVTTHKNKNGTRTLGGLVFVFATCLVVPFFLSSSSRLAYIALAVFLSFGLLGFLDDFIKIRTHKNMGLRAYQKIIGQLGISVLIAIFVYNSNLIGTQIYLPWSFEKIDIGWGIIPLTILVFLAVTNSANLTDGLDGLAGGVSFVALTGLCVLIAVLCGHLNNQGVGLNIIQEYHNLILLGVCVCGGVLAFLCVNSYPAKIFMGDTGSLALGGVIATIAVFTQLSLVLPILCVCFLVSAVSVLIQVVYYKLKHKRVFLMAPLHHHFEKKGVHESKIVAIYIIVTILSATLTIVLSII
ncbi:MAG: phospho-N-acetylmuramoyl-pentapeptide-transferase [Clostridia bacterium]|nr:phospho-N-acetylmuramoyl-pentapeptide-transferase [Clostridia bacterium]